MLFQQYLNGAANQIIFPNKQEPGKTQLILRNTKKIRLNLSLISKKGYTFVLSLNYY